MREKRQRRLPSRVTVMDARGNKHTAITNAEDIKKLASRLRFDHPEHSSADGFTVSAQGFDVDSCIKGVMTRELKVRQPRG